ncbi:hypothetical protein, partial [Leptospira alexanderi]|uniref:hypothetical protein n=1 Tax=Leptospira alexanderi TaxID=100053 RepID=UPI001C37AF7B
APAILIFARLSQEISIYKLFFFLIDNISNNHPHFVAAQHINPYNRCDAYLLQQIDLNIPHHSVSDIPLILYYKL